ncbi:phosphatase PAP2 family protein [Rhizohabitans arisaemae]|uniref:phosphatase PAP2 family protein n=1 Tax=Rhizohabitans arisaemae TaxID=2720610 RepID=UPI0024B1A38B|nr:phosphatase PAP2 family protein [Rhizohabitans arisaemae]
MRTMEPRRAALVTAATVGVITLGGVAVAAPASATGLSPEPGPVENVPGFSVDWYLDVVTFASLTPKWLQSFTAFFTSGAVVLLAVIMIVGWWLARRKDAHQVALSLLAPVGAGAAYLVSETIKTFLATNRPCRTFRSIVTVAECPPMEDWTFPSNHATVAGAAAMGIFFFWRAMSVPAFFIAVSTAFSRVFIGVHYPHDVIVGFLIGCVVVSAVILMFEVRATRLVERLRPVPLLAPLLSAGGGGGKRRRGGSLEPSAQSQNTDRPPREWR